MDSVVKLLIVELSFVIDVLNINIITVILTYRKWLKKRFNVQYAVVYVNLIAVQNLKKEYKYKIFISVIIV